MRGLMQILATATVFATAMDRLRSIPTEFWVRIGIALAVIIGVAIALRKLAQVNKVVLCVGAGLIASIVGFSWIYERNEPSWASPVVGWLANYFPSKGKVEPAKSSHAATHEPTRMDANLRNTC